MSRLTPGLRRWGISASAVLVAGVVTAAVMHRPTQATAAPVTTRVSLETLFAGIGERVTNESLCTEGRDALPLFMYSAWTDTEKGDASLFSGTARAEMASRVATASRVAIIRTLETSPPRSVAGSPLAGRYDAELVIVDTATGRRECATRVVAWSSDSVAQPGVSERVLRADFIDRVHAAMSDAAARLHVTIEL